MFAQQSVLQGWKNDHYQLFQAGDKTFTCASWSQAAVLTLNSHLPFQSFTLSSQFSITNSSKSELLNSLWNQNPTSLPPQWNQGALRVTFSLGKLLVWKVSPTWSWWGSSWGPQLAWGAVAKCADDAEEEQGGVQGQSWGTVSCQPTSRWLRGLGHTAR